MATSKIATETPATIREKLRFAAKESGMTHEEIGLRMGFAKDSARKAVSRLLNLGAEYDPRLSTLLSFAKAVNRPLKELV
jgi:transcriptional regulator with XRE-family HTH domain